MDIWYIYIYIYIHIYTHIYIYICDISITYPSYIHHISIITSFTNFPCPSVLNISTWRFLPSASRPIAIQVTSDGVRNGHGPENRGQAEKDAWRGAGGVNDGGYFIERKEDVYSQQNFRCYFVMCMWYITCIWSNCCVYIYIYMMYTYGCENSNVYGYGIYICMDGIGFQLQHDSEDHPGQVLKTPCLLLLRKW